MKHINSKYHLLVYLLLILVLNRCESKAQKFTHTDLIEDLRYLNEAITSGHPITLNKAWANQLEPFITKLENDPAGELTAFNYENIVRKALALVGCAHTVIKESPLSVIYKKEIGDLKYLPMRFYADSSGLYAIETMLEKEGGSLNLPIKIHSINHLNAKAIIDKLLFYQPVDGHQKSMGYAVINRYSEILIRRLFIGTDDFVIKYEQAEGAPAEIKIKAEKEYLPEGLKHSVPQQKIPTEGSIDLYALDPRSLYLKLETFNYEDYKTSHASVFEYANTNEVENLIIDVRGNGGGKPKLALDFLSYILSDTISQIDIRPRGDVGSFLSSKYKLLGVWFWDKVTNHQQTDLGTIYTTNVTYPKHKLYKKNIYVLTDGFTASTASTLAAFLKHKAGAICLGQETAGGETGCNANSFQTLQLPRSGIKIHYPLFRFDYQLSIPENHHGIIPDYIISYDAQTTMLNKDLEMNKVRLMIQKKAWRH